MATFCDFHHIYKVDISQMIEATAEAVLQKSWQVVLEETLGGHQVQFFTYTEVAIPRLDRKTRED